MATRVQFATAAANPSVPTFGSTPTSGNLLIVTAVERVGTTHANFTIDGTGWTKRIGRDIELADSGFRRTLVVWTKIAGASEPTAISVDNGTANTIRCVAEEFEFDVGDDQFVFDVAASNDNGTTSNATTISSGTTASVTGTKWLVWTCAAARTDADWAANFVTSAWTNSLADEVEYNGPGSNTAVHTAYYGADTATGTKESTVTFSSGGSPTNTGLGAGIMVFSLVADAGGATTVTPANASLSFAGLQPSLYLHATLQPGNASLSFAGLQPTLYTHALISPANASLSFAGAIPTISTALQQTVAPGNASLSFAGLTPTVLLSSGHFVQPDNASLSFAGLEPTLLLHATLSPEPASLSFAGLRPTINTQGTVRGHVNTGRRWRGRVYGLSYSDEVAIVPTVGKPPLPTIEPAKRVGIGGLDIKTSLAVLTPPARKVEPARRVTVFPAVDADAKATAARAVRRMRQARIAEIYTQTEYIELQTIESQLRTLIEVMIEQRAQRAHLGKKRHVHRHART